MKMLFAILCLFSFFLGFTSFADNSKDDIPEDQCVDPKRIASQANFVPHLFYPPKHKTESSCTNIDLRSKFPEVHDQDQTGWCYAFVAADMLGYELGKPVSGIDIALKFQSKKEHREAHLAALEERGTACMVPTADSYIGGETNLALEDLFIKSSVCLRKALSNSAGFVDQIKTLEDLSLTKDALTKDDLTALSAAFSFLFPKSDAKKMLAAYLKLRGKETFIFEKLAKLACAKHQIKIPALKVKQMNVDNTIEAMRTAHNKIDEFLESGRPLAFSDALIFDYAYYDVPVLTDQRNHEMILVGRQWNEKKKTCEYIVRNSHGSDCSAYEKPGVENSEKSSEGLGLSPLKCEAGNVFVPESVFFSTLNGLTWLERGK